MKCPKCGYLGFDSGERCRHCGYDFSLVGTPAREDPSARHAPSAAPGSQPGDPRFARGARYGRSARRGDGTDRPLAAQPEGTPVDLPLFGVEGAPLPPPRAPLAVRRATPTPTRIRPRTPTPQPSEMPLLGNAADPPAPALDSGDIPHVPPQNRAAEGLQATAGRRAAAAAIDLCLVALVDLVVLHFTLALCGLSFGDLRVLPVVPMLAFLLLLNWGYVVLFTGTLGQTFGKMATSIEVVPARQERMGLGRAALRGTAMALSLLPAGVGWLAGLVGDHRSLHDRLAGTRVVRSAGA